MDSSSCSDLSPSLVQEIAASLTDGRVPERFIHEKGFSPAEEEAIGSDLLIDFSSLSTEDELGKLRSALSTWGCFLVVNHGIEAELLEKILEASRDFFALPLEEKKKWYGDSSSVYGYGNDGLYSGNRTRSWNDRLSFRLDSAHLGSFPDNPPQFGKIVRELGDRIQAMPEKILKAIGRSLNLEEDSFLKSHGLDGANTARINFQPRCPDPNRILGIGQHTDATTLTMLLPDGQGLQIMANGRWFKVPVIVGALFVIFGDLMEIMSNGAIKSTLHRVVANSEKERISVAMFFSPNDLKEISPIGEMITSDRPQMYKKTNVINYVHAYTDSISQGRSALLAFRV